MSKMDPQVKQRVRDFFAWKAGRKESVEKPSSSTETTMLDDMDSGIWPSQDIDRSRRDDVETEDLLSHDCYISQYCANARTPTCPGRYSEVCEQGLYQHNGGKSKGEENAK